ncbi:hypothetical protein PTSG_00788 [Salpingoeca rosetta]|uniref:Uncharacterized protein n=1 Tax=Salpingoeca rosetta (strain ATCC 50818 / BSB-021) TaxID=946362 RepID=F2TXH2_SALR5|nr:uncharacterized protein PTSG_00788 [Salpingoeca rosetta]EGD76081.1 hypothetical protein PTSG_00788 [Salpingoeca rosetta]|eukprot:XP_004998256.1 hypothetical protein PTSG_00788 [Salpingoeca rosetta]
MLLSRMVKHSRKAGAGLLAVGVRIVADETDPTPYAPLHVAHKYPHSSSSSSSSKAHLYSSAFPGGDRDALVPREVDPSLAVLHQCGTDVDPDLLLADWRMHEIKNGPLMSNGAARDELEAWERELLSFKEKESLVPVSQSEELNKKLDILYGRHVIEVTLGLSDAGFQAFKEAGFKRLHKRLDTLRRRRDAIEAALEADDIPKAMDLTRRALLACQRFEQHLARVLREIRFEERVHSSRAKKALSIATAGGFVIVGVTFDFFGVLPAGLVSSAAMETITKFVTAGMVLCCSYAAFAYLHSLEARQYVHQLRRIGLDIESFKHE